MPVADPVDPEELGRAKERADVARWLRGGPFGNVMDGQFYHTLRDLARCIERLDHHRDRTDDQP